MLVNLLIPFAAYLLAEEIHASGILAAVAAGIAMSYVELTVQLQRHHVRAAGRAAAGHRRARDHHHERERPPECVVAAGVRGGDQPGADHAAPAVGVAVAALEPAARTPPRPGAGRGAELAHRGRDLGGRRARCDHPGRCADPAAVPARWQRVPGPRPGDLPGRVGDPVLAAGRQHRAAPAVEGPAAAGRFGRTKGRGSGTPAVVESGAGWGRAHAPADGDEPEHRERAAVQRRLFAGEPAVPAAPG
ncbi:hypothetical protein G6F22_016482 [Rhizopus arrhizus]|nr:hypothetical protein G6F22_016482 [Rhizopus arrhizus]